MLEMHHTPSTQSNSVAEGQSYKKTNPDITERAQPEEHTYQIIIMKTVQADVRSYLTGLLIEKLTKNNMASLLK